MDILKISSVRNPPADLHAVIEIPVGGVPVKYELDKVSGAMFVDRFFHTAMFYPGNYGLIPHALSEDSDPCDIMVVGSVPVVPGAVIHCRPVGALLMQNEAGLDEKVLAGPVDELHPLLFGHPQPHRPPFCADGADRSLPRALQGSRKRQMGEGRALA